MGLILDSSVVIAAERQGQTAYEMLEAIGAQAADPEIAVSVVTVLELAHGIAQSTARPNARLADKHRLWPKDGVSWP